MKKIIFKFLLPFLFGFLIGTPFHSFASYELDRKYALESIGALKSWDNIDGVFSAYFEKSFQEYFKNQSRFRYVETSVLSKILEDSSLPYHELIENKKILERVVRAGRIETLLRTKIFKEGQNFRVQFDWLHSSQLDLLAQTEFNYTSKGVEYDQNGDSLRIKIHEGLNALFKSIPFQGHLTGVDQKDVTLNLGFQSGIKKGEILEISSLEDVRTHPLLGKLEDWRMVPIGKVEIIEVQEKMSFGKIISKSGQEAFDRYQKISSISPPQKILPSENTSKNSSLEYEGSHTNDQEPSTLSEEGGIPSVNRLGYLSGGISVGSLSRKMKGQTFANEGSGFYFSPQIQGELWITRDFFGSLSISPHFFGNDQTNTLNGIPETLADQSGTGFQFDLAGGYYLHFTENFFGPKAYVKMGYRSHSYQLAESLQTSTSSTQYKSLYIGMGGEVPIKEIYGAYAELNFGLLRSVTDTLFLSATPSSTSDIQVQGGGYYWINQKVSIRGGIQLFFKGAEYSNGDSVQHHVTGFTLKGLYYF